MHPFSARLITLNEEHNIRRTLPKDGANVHEIVVALDAPQRRLRARIP